jgi:hypothetical protein
MNFGRRLQARLSRAVPGLPVSPALGDTFSGEIGLGEDLVLVESPEDDILDDLRYWDEGGAFSIFGDDMGVEQSSILALVKSGDEGLNALTAAYGRASVGWMAKDPSAHSDFLNDLLALQMRWGAAKSALGGAGGIVSGIMSAGTAGLYAGQTGQAIYDNLYKALHQGGKDAPLHKGDFNDLSERLKKVTTFDWKPSTDSGGALSTIQSMIPGGSSIPGVPGGLSGLIPDWAKPGGLGLPDPTGDLLKWWRQNEHFVVIAITVIGGLMLAGVLVGLVKGAPIAAKMAAVKYLPVAA